MSDTGVTKETQVESPSFCLKAIVIDDAFDKELQASQIKLTKFQEFYQNVNEEKAFDEILKKFHLVVPDLYDANDGSPEYLDFLNKLWSLRNTEESIKAYVDDELFSDQIHNIEDVNKICSNLESQELELLKLDSKHDDFEVVKKGDYGIIFLDYNLGPSPGPLAVANARKKALALYEACEKKPIMILMSSYDNVANELENFKGEGGMAQVVFRFAAKEKLMNNDTASLLVQAYKNESEHIHKLQNYITILNLAANNALKLFKTDVATLNIDDYSFIHNTTVKDQAHPLGDYLGWLYGAHWTNLLLRNPELKTEKDALDKLLSERPSLHHTMPSSPKIIEIYMSALFEDSLGDITDHALQGSTAGDSRKVIAKLPHLHLGDIFMKTDKEILWMVLNPQCDLERPVDESGENSILLIPGELYLLDAKNEVQGQKTELIIVQDKHYRIVWKLKQMISVKLKNFTSWYTRRKLKRELRLRLPYALEVQQAFTSIISRVGLPVAPPFTEEVSVEVLIKKQKDKFDILLEAKPNYAFLPVIRKPSKIIRLTLNFALDLKESIGDEKKRVVESIAIAGGTADKYLLEMQKKLTELIEKFDAWFIEKNSFDSSKKIDLIAGYISALVDYNSENTDIKSLPFLLINIKSKDISKKRKSGNKGRKKVEAHP